MFKQSETMVTLTDAVIDADPNDDEEPVVTASSQYFYKPLGGGKTAVLLINTDSSAATLEVDFKVRTGKISK